MTDKPASAKAYDDASEGASVVTASKRGVHIDYCPRCGAWAGAPCTTPGGREVPDHTIRAPQCNGRDTCNAHGGRCG